ncbi:MAG: F0F1 ATP synthase subunit epsilon [Cypionkella sp.]
MASTVQFDLVSPERRLASFAASEVGIPAADGDMTAMAGHAPTITGMRAGILRASGTDGVKSYVVTGGFAEISASGVSVLAERAIAVEDLTPTIMDALVADACEAAAVSANKDVADKAVADMMAIKAAVGL